MQGIFFLCKILILPTLFFNAIRGKRGNIPASFGNRRHLRAFSIFYVKTGVKGVINR